MNAEKKYIKVKLGRLKSSNLLNLSQGEKKKDIAEKYFEEDFSLLNGSHLLKAVDREKKNNNININLNINRNENKQDSYNKIKLREENLAIFRKNRIEEFKNLRGKKSNTFKTQSHSIIDYSLNKSDHPSYSENSKNKISSIISFINNKERDRDFFIREKMKIKSEKIKALIEKSKIVESSKMIKQIY